MTSRESSTVSTDNLTRRFGARRAVDGVTLEVAAGQALALFGPNGAGKTTLLRILAGIIRPSFGSASIGSTKLPGGPDVRRRIGIISHHTLLYDALSARENVEFAARLYGVADARGETERVLSEMRILDRADNPVRSLSRGLRQRVSVARAIVHGPDVVLADEPFTGLDVSGARALATLLSGMIRAGAALVLVTHNIHEGLSLATHAAIMHKGKIVRLESREMVDPATFTADYQSLVEANG